MRPIFAVFSCEKNFHLIHRISYKKKEISATLYTGSNLSPHACQQFFFHCAICHVMQCCFLLARSKFVRFAILAVKSFFSPHSSDSDENFFHRILLVALIFFHRILQVAMKIFAALKFVFTAFIVLNAKLTLLIKFTANVTSISKF